jgi:hypothetical protein
MSDSLSATVIDIVLLFTISANGDAPDVDEEDEEPELPRPPAVVPAVVPVVDVAELPLFDAEDVEAVPVEPDDTLPPAVMPASDTTVPLIGAYSFVPASAVLALSTLAWALSTAAWAEAIVAAGSVAPLDPDVPEPVEPDPPEADAAELAVPVDADLPGAVVGAGAAVVGAAVVVVAARVVCVAVEAGVVTVVVGAALSSDANSVVPEPELVSRPVVTVVESDSALLS